MKRAAALGALIVALVCTGNLQADNHHKAWMSFLKGTWEYDWNSEGDGYVEKGEVTYTLAAGGNVIVGRIVTENGDKEIETWGWRPSSKTMVIAGYSSNGSFWHYEYTDVEANKMTGICFGTDPDNQDWEGNATLAKKGSGFEVTVKGTVEGSDVVSVGRLTRKTFVEDGAIPPKALEELSYMVGKWETTFSVDDEEVGHSSHTRDWAPGEHCLRFESSGEGEGKRRSSVGTSGWNAKTQQIVEHWHTSDGLFITVRYPVAGMKKNVWRGTFNTVHPNGKEESGRCVLKKQDKDNWTWTARWQERGISHTREAVTRRQ
jgi:hypothetical protein